MTTIHDQRQEIHHLKGLTPPEVETSRQTNGSNVMTPPPREAAWRQFLGKFDDPVIRILIMAAAIAISLGIVNGNYVEGIGIIVAIALATTLAFLNEYKANQEFDILNRMNDEVPIKVIRDHSFTTIPKKDIVVGDIVIIELGDEIPADGQLVEAVSLRVNEASLTGESEAVKKLGKSQLEASGELPDSAYPPDRLLRGTVVTDGHGTFEVTAVGDSTEIGQTAQLVCEITNIDTPLKQQLDRLSRLIGVLGLAIAVLIDIALVVRGILTGNLNLSLGQWYIVALAVTSLIITLVRVWLPIVYDGLEISGYEATVPEWLEDDHAIGWVKSTLIGLLVFGVGIAIGYGGNFIPDNVSDWIPASAATEFVTYFMIAVAVIVVAVPEGLALSVTLSLAYSMRKMTKQNNLVRRMHACETIGAATVICSDKTGTLTMNKMQVQEINFPSFSHDIPSDLLTEAIAANSTANLEQHENQKSKAIGNPTEAALLLWLEQNQIDYLSERNRFEVKQQLAFTPDLKYMVTLGISAINNQEIMHIKGAPDIVLGHCSSYLSEKGVITLTPESRRLISQELKNCDAGGMRTLGFAYIPQPQLEGDDLNVDDRQDVVWLGFVAIADPVRPEVPEAVRQCRQAGIDIKMITGDSLLTAAQIGSQIGIIDENDTSEAYITGSQLREMDDELASKTLKKVRVIGRARPQDKQRIVQLLQAQGEVVAVTGDGTNDAAALNQAQVGLAMGSGTFVAKEASDIILLDDSFRSVKQAVLWGRSLYQNIQKFILFQLTINVVACIIALLGPFIGINLPFTVIQLLWVNLIMDTFAALALATEPPSERVMEVPPRNPEDFIISPAMSSSIFTVGAAFLVILVGFLLYIQSDHQVTAYELSLFFTSFVMLQFWNLFNAKCFGSKDSVLSQLWQNPSFLAIAGVIFIGQILIVQFGGSIFRTVPLCLTDWLWIIGGTSLVLWIGESNRAIVRWRKG
ncbi:calcium-translocating P-type ATPase, PMCA-type [Arthrospira sp. O9.13F]|nr:calcium-translocating P-type ATPase, PMCA-type [Arthrospira sp. O9.13F]